VGEIVMRVEGIDVWGHHGCERCEETEGGPFAITLEARYPEPADPRADSFDGRPDYALLTERAAALFSAQRYRLIEPLAAVIAESLLDEFGDISAIRVTIRKLKPVIAMALAHAEVTVERRRTDGCASSTQS